MAPKSECAVFDPAAQQVLENKLPDTSRAPVLAPQDPLCGVTTDTNDTKDMPLVWPRRRHRPNYGHRTSRWHHRTKDNRIPCRRLESEGVSVSWSSRGQRRHACVSSSTECYLTIDSCPLYWCVLYCIVLYCTVLYCNLCGRSSLPIYPIERALEAL